jgi:Ca-activated chloride channel homolog
MKQQITAAVLAVIAFSTFAFAQTQPADDEIIKVETTLISVPVIVSDRNGRYISNLKAKDFTVYENGVKQNIDFFAPTEEPLNVALLIDTSRSTEPVLNDIKDAAIEFIRQLQPRDRATIVSFDYEPHVLTRLTSNKNDLIQAVEYAEIGEYVGTTLRDAVLETINNTFADVKGRKAIILMTDGKDARSQASIEELMRSTEESDAMIYSIFYETGGGMNRFNNRGNNRQNERFPQRRGGIFNDRFPNDRRYPDEDYGRGFPNRRQQQRNSRVSERNAEAEEFLQELSASTAGRYYRSEVEDLNDTFSSIIGELRYQYRLGFYPSEQIENNADIAREIRVQVARNDAVVRARRNYRLEKK